MRLALLLLGAAALSANELSTGALLGPGYDPRAFYNRESAKAKWVKTYSGPEWRPEAQGKLMNLRLAQGLFHDEWLTEKPFDAGKNTDALIAALDWYKEHGVLMVCVSMQGGQAGYDPKVNGVDRQNGYRFGREKGTYVSAFERDGARKTAWLARLERLLKAAAQRGMFVNVMYFYQGQDESLDGPPALHAAARNLTRWIAGRGHRNVMIDVANEYDLRDGRWDFDRYIPNNAHKLVREVQDELRSKHVLIPVAASSDGRMQYPEPMMSVSDVVLIHGNGRTPEQKQKRADELRDVRKPVLMNEDDNGRETLDANLARELASCDIFFRHAGGWGYMPYVQAQRFPFRYSGDGDRDMRYFHAVLDRIAELTRSRPPHRK